MVLRACLTSPRARLGGIFSALTALKILAIRQDSATGASSACFSFLRWCGYTNLAGSLHLELVHGLAGLGNIDAVVLLRHFLFSFSIFCGSAAYRQRRIGRRNRSRPFLLELRRRADVFVLRPCRNHIICIPAPNMPPAHPVIFCRKKAQCLCFKKVMLPPF